MSKILYYRNGNPEYPVYEIAAGKDVFECEQILDAVFVLHPAGPNRKSVLLPDIPEHTATWMITNHPQPQVFCTICGKPMEFSEAKRIIESHK